MQMLHRDMQMILKLQDRVIREEFHGRLQRRVATQASKAFSSGKKIRPLARHLVRKTFGLELNESVLSIEALHKSSLVLDNMMDEDPYMSPGQPSLHTVLGPAQASMVANFLSDLAFKLERKENTPTLLERLELLNDLQIELFEGITAEADAYPSLEVWRKVTARKSALMRGSFELAAIDTGQSRETMARIGSLFTELLQINDDLDDVKEKGLNIVTVTDPEELERILEKTVSELQRKTKELQSLGPILEFYQTQSKYRLRKVLLREVRNRGV